MRVGAAGIGVGSRRGGKLGVIARGWGAFAGIFLTGAAGCVNTVVPSPRVEDPVTVYIGDHGLHASLLLPREDAGFREYAYGQWEWYAKGNEGSGRVFGVLFIPQDGALGRTDWDEERPEDLKAALGVEELLAVRVERARAKALLEKLDARFEARASEMYFNAFHGLEFVPDDRQYWLGHGCTGQVNAWLREMGCRVTGSAAWSDYRVRGAR